MAHRLMLTLCALFVAHLASSYADDELLRTPKEERSPPSVSYVVSLPFPTNVSPHRSPLPPPASPSLGV
jgi:hypothetical protein